MGDLKTFFDYYRVGSSTVGRYTIRTSTVAGANNLLEDDALTIWMSGMLARHIEAPLTRLWNRLLDRMDW